MQKNTGLGNRRHSINYAGKMSSGTNRNVKMELDDGSNHWKRSGSMAINKSMTGTRP